MFQLRFLKRNATPSIHRYFTIIEQNAIPRELNSLFIWNLTFAQSVLGTFHSSQQNNPANCTSISHRCAGK